MKNTGYKIAVALLSVAVVVLSLLLYIAHRTKVEQSPTVEKPILKASAVSFHPGGPTYDVVVWSRVHLNQTVFDSPEFFQTRIEVTRDFGTVTYEWPREYECDPDSAALMDLAGDGTKVFVLSCGMDLRVVQFTGKEFMFRPSADRLESVGSQSRFEDLNHDGRVEYVASLNYPQKFGDPKNYLTLPFPVIYRWNREQGFQEVSREFAQYYRTQAIPVLRKLQEESEDPQRKPLFDAAIAYIEQRISGAAGQQMLPQS